MSSDYSFCPRCAAPLAWLELAGLPRRACLAANCGFVHWDNPTPVVAALVEWRGSIVLARNQAWAEGTFGLIAGFLERGEEPADAAAREVKEELNLAASAVTLIGAYAFPRKHELILAYHVAATGEIALNEELAEYRCIAPDRLKPWDFGTGLAVRDWLAQTRSGAGS
ncbi:MAG: NUDIX domain-containing protein [Rhodocyclaceae bacterium]|nr:NUDIX domain-containing protein [Rhodocyclaceae bacterium]